ncbi:MAG: peptidylprolyl isomerase [Planctomycetota bacterium]
MTMPAVTAVLTDSIRAAAAVIRTALAGVLLPLAGCASTLQPTEMSSVSTAPTSPATLPADAGVRPAAMLAGEAIAWEDLRARLLESAGGRALEELVLEAALRGELRAQGLAVDEAAVERESQIAFDALAPDPTRAAQLLAALRDAQSLGPVRWRALLWRNAALRALAQREVRLSEDAVRQAFDAAHGVRRVCRIIVVPDMPSAERVQRRLEAGEPFGEIAFVESSDASAARGGLLPPISRSDPSFPAAFREVLFTTDVGGRSHPVLLEGGYAIVEVRSEVPSDGSNPAATRAADERAARRALERVEMDRLARMLLRRSKPTVFDDALQESWRMRPRTQE